MDLWVSLFVTINLLTLNYWNMALTPRYSCTALHDWKQVQRLMTPFAENTKHQIQLEKECLWRKKTFGLTVWRDTASHLQKQKRQKSVEQFLTFFYFCIQLEGRKISSNQFLKVLSTLRVWEICAPDINAAVEVSIVDLTQWKTMIMDTLLSRCPKPLFQSEANCEPTGMKTIFFLFKEKSFSGQ